MDKVTPKLTLISYFDKMLLEPLVEFTKLISADMPVETDWSSGSTGSWYMSPRQHTIEFLIYTLVFTLFAAYFFNKGLRNEKVFIVSENSTKRTVGEILLLIALGFSLTLVTIHKSMTDSTIFLLQPCHMSLLLLIIVLVYPKTRKLPHILFNIYLNIMWGTIMALLFPDYRACTMYLEVENFIFEHWLILLTPIYIFHSRKVLVWKPSVSMTLAAHAFYGIYNSTILAALALISGKNINYQLSPPIELLPLGKYYRFLMFFVFVPVTFFMRWILVSFAFKLTPRARLVSMKKQL